jgi:hypothetical protein
MIHDFGMAMNCPTSLMRSMLKSEYAAVNTASIEKDLTEGFIDGVVVDAYSITFNLNPYQVHAVTK